MKDVALTTVDNPFNPFYEFENWLRFDLESGYNTCGLLDKVCYTSDALTDKENYDSVESAIDSIIEADFLNLYRKIYKSD